MKGRGWVRVKRCSSAKALAGRVEVRQQRLVTSRFYLVQSFPGFYESSTQEDVEDRQADYEEKYE